MKKVAIIVLNRNLPKETDKLCNLLKKNNGDLADIFVVESGSDKNNLSKSCTWWANCDEFLANGLRYPRGFNFGLLKLFEENKYENYDYFMLLCNDAKVSNEPLIAPLLEVMAEHPRVGILSPCSHDWGESDLIGENSIRYFWHINHNAWLVRRDYIDDVRELEEPSSMNFLYDGSNFRGYESDIELMAKGYVNDWATAITTKVYVDENKEYLKTKADLIKTDPYDESLKMCLEEGTKWLRSKYGFNSRWSMQMYTKYFYDEFFKYNPEFIEFKL